MLYRNVLVLTYRRISPLARVYRVIREIERVSGNLSEMLPVSTGGKYNNYRLGPHRLAISNAKKKKKKRKGCLLK